MPKSKTEVRRIKTLSETAGEFLTAALGPVEEQFKGRVEELGVVSVIFTWNSRDNQLTLSRYSEATQKPRKAAKKAKATTR